ncbi:MAG: SemiSWEET transporter [Bacteroidetes bacterium]|jgi:MtN3 and saliva related transmembrane protein|nr:SemiSWEET transporter [Bacteroidota bacterium]
MPSLEPYIGYLAALLTTLAFVPQVLKTWRTRAVRDLSLSMTLLFALGVALWLVYGLLRQDVPIIGANIITLVLVLALLAMKLRWGRRGR